LCGFQPGLGLVLVVRGDIGDSGGVLSVQAMAVIKMWRTGGGHTRRTCKAIKRPTTHADTTKHTETEVLNSSGLERSGSGGDGEAVGYRV
jgi:hypothetical protein